MNHPSLSTWRLLSAALVGCNGQVLDVGSTGQALAQSEGGRTEPRTIAILQSAPVTMASDGVTLYWRDATTADVVGMSVQGGPRTSIATNTFELFLAVDSANVYFLRDVQLYAAPKIGGAAALVLSDRSGSVTAAAVVGGQAFWAETPDQQPRAVAVKSVA